MEQQPAKNNGCWPISTSYLGFHWKGILTLLVPLILLPICFAGGADYRCLYVVCVMAILWITEAIPLYVTSMIPVVAFPLLGILDSDKTCRQYFKNPLVLFTGGLIVALAIEYSNLHKRTALKVILIVGCSPRRLHVGIAFVSMFISMWISNAATTAMMCPIIRAVLEELDAQNVCKMYEPEPEGAVDVEKKDHPRSPSKVACSYYLGAAYGATIGGCCTLIGTPTNLTFKGIYESRFPDTTEVIEFPAYMVYATPIMFIDTILCVMYLQWFHMGLFRPSSVDAQNSTAPKEAIATVREIVKTKYTELGTMTCHEIQVGILFLLMIILLFTRSPGFMDGWADHINKGKIAGSMAMIMIVILLFMLPINYYCYKFWCGSAPFPKKTTPSLISWKFVQVNLPWGLIFLLGGGYALAEGSSESGMATMLGNAMNGLKDCPLPLIQLLCLVAAVFLTAFSANVAICNILVPVVAELSIAVECHPLYLIIPTGLGCSMGFHLPVSTPANAIVTGYANVTTKQMAIAGIGPTIITIIVLFASSQSWQYVIWSETSEFPSWALPTTTAKPDAGAGGGGR